MRKYLYDNYNDTGGDAGSLASSAGPTSFSSMASGLDSNGDPATALAMSAGGSTTTDTVSFAGSGITFVNTFSAAANANSAYKNAILAAEHQIASEWSNNITLHLYFNTSASGQNGTLASNSWSSWTNVSYATLRSALLAHSPGDSLPTSDPNPAGGSDWYLPEAYARMLGLSSSTPTYDDSITLNTSYGWSYSQDVIDTIEHEITEGGMGRVGGLGHQNGVWSAMDLFRYSAANTHDYTWNTTSTYFSQNGTNLSPISFDTSATGGDVADFNAHDVFGYGYTGETNTLSTTDMQVMNALGWTNTTTDLYDFYYVYNDGSVYYGTVADNGKYGYYAGDKINGSNGGYYYIYGNSGATSESAGTVWTNSYWDSTSSQWYTPWDKQHGSADGSNGLGSEYDWTYGAKNFENFGLSGRYEAKQGTNTLFSFYYQYSDGDIYYGTASSDYYIGNYYLGETISGTNGGHYYIYANDGNTTTAAGTVNTSVYYEHDNGTYTAYTPVLGKDGTNGLGSEFDYIWEQYGVVKVPQFYGQSGKYEA